MVNKEINKAKLEAKREEDVAAIVKAAQAKKAATANIKASEVEAAIAKKAATADIETQRKIDVKKKIAQAALEAKEVTHNRIFEELYDEIAIGPFNKSENYPFDKRGNDPFGSLYKLSMFGNKVFDALVS